MAVSLALERIFATIMDRFIALDFLVQAWVAGIQSPVGVWLMNFITYLGSSLAFLFMTFVISVYLISKQKLYVAIFLNASLLSARWLTVVLKNLFERSRPAGEALTIASGYSLPSGHAIASMAFYGYLAVWLLRQKDRPAARWEAVSLFLLIILIGFSRIYLNVHYLSDVLAGFVLGYICLRVSLSGLDKVVRR